MGPKMYVFLVFLIPFSEISSPDFAKSQVRVGSLDRMEIQTFSFTISVPVCNGNTVAGHEMQVCNNPTMREKNIRLL